MGDRPWFKFYPTDWRADQALRLCSAAARGLWLECLCLMHEAEPYGHLLVNGRQVSEAQLANLAGIGHGEVAPLLSELDAAGVFSRNGDGVIYSRRMMRDAARAEAGARYGRLGGNPRLMGRDKGEGNAGPSPRVQSPRVQNQIQNQSPEGDIKDVILSSSRSLKNETPWTAERKKAAWQSRVCAWAQAEMPAAAYADFLGAWANGERWAVTKAEAFSAAIDAARRRKEAQAGGGA